MPPRKGGKKKKTSSKKRKSTNVWDDYTPKPKGRRSNSDDDDDETNDSKKRKHNESMLSQWKKRKLQVNSKRAQFYGSMEEKKQRQLEKYLEQRQKHAEVVLYGGKQPVKARTQYHEQKDNTMPSGSDDSESDASNSEDDLMVQEKKATKKQSVFDQFVQTFQTAGAISDEDEQDDDSEEEYERVLVDADGNEISDEEENEYGDSDHGEDVVDEKLDDDAMEAEEEEEPHIHDESEEHEMALNQDPYRHRYLLTDFTEENARAFDKMVHKYLPLQLENIPSASDYQVTIRPGYSSQSSTISSSKLYIRSRLLSSWKAKGLDVETLYSPDSIEATLFQQFCSYTDVFYAAQTYENTQSLRRLSVMHVLNHIIKARDTVTRNNERLRKRQFKEEENGDEANGVAEEDEEKEYRDQGFCRATVLVLLPLRSAAMAFVKLLLELLPENVNTFHNKDRFFSEYGSAADEDDGENDKSMDENDEGMKEWQKVFAEGNNDDSFQIGLSLSRKALRFYSDYHHADIILASSLGLRQQLGDEVVELDEAIDGDNKSQFKLSTDFLSSIEICVVDSASLIMMQNIEHLRSIVKALNVQPKEAPNADFARIREWNLSFLGAYFRQTILYAHGVEPSLNYLMNKCCRNLSGTIKYIRNYDAADGSASISRIVPQIKQIFQRIDLDYQSNKALSAKEEVDIRFEYFKKHIFEPLLDHPKKHVLIFIPSYFDYVRVRNLFNESMTKKLIRCMQCCEYTSNKQVSRARTSFFHGKTHVLLYTERFHFYHQYHMRGIHQLIWYGVPSMGEFYPEMINMLGGNSAHSGQDEDDDIELGDNKSSIALFTRLDLFRMQRIVGNKRAERMCQPKAKKPTFLFC